MYGHYAKGQRWQSIYSLEEANMAKYNLNSPFALFFDVLLYFILHLAK
jgi:hypothetical protein